ncbi:MAG TPA: exodeoxyribonuclease VII large subunit, partial [Acidimicrobiales bacterium]
RLARCATAVLDGADRRLDELSLRLATTSRRRLDDAASRIELLATRTDLLDPAHVLARGWSIARTHDGRTLRSVHEVEVGDVIEVRIGDGTLHTRIERVDHDGRP